MHAAFASDTITRSGEGQFRASFPPLPPAPAPSPAPPSGRYGDDRGPSLRCTVTVIAIHAVALVGLVKADVIALRKAPPKPLVVVNLVEPPAPPPPPSTPEPRVEVVRPVETPIVSPPPIVAAPAPPPPVAVVAETPPPQALVVAPAPKAAVPSAPVSVDLSTKLISGRPPRYPIESRRKREQGTVVLRVTLALDGSVASLSVAQSSGFERLDRAALDAVRNWRWSPTIVGGQPVSVVGVVPFPFVMQG